MPSLVAIRFEEDPPELRLLDQRFLPSRQEWLGCRSAEEVAAAIRDMVVRGAPAIGIAAAYGMALAQLSGEELRTARAALASSRPTAVNLRWVLERLDPLVSSGGDLLAEARTIHAEDVAIKKRPA